MFITLLIKLQCKVLAFYNIMLLLCPVQIQNKYSNKMEIASEIVEMLQKAVTEFTHEAICKEAGINYRTLKRIMDKKECKPYIFPTLISAVERLQKQRQKQLNKVLSNSKA